jgi:hypothetical protein
VVPAQTPGIPVPVLDPWAPQTVSHLIQYLAVSGQPNVSAQDEAYRVTISADERTRFWCPAGSTDPDAISATGIRVDITPRAHATLGVASPSDLSQPDGARD